MKKELATIAELKELGFQELTGDNLDRGGFYRWWGFYKNDSELHLTYEYNSDKKFEKGYLEFNGEVLKGRELTIKDLKFIIEIM